MNLFTFFLKIRTKPYKAVAIAYAVYLTCQSVLNLLMNIISEGSLARFLKFYTSGKNKFV